jgi:hypothetical protein
MLRSCFTRQPWLKAVHHFESKTRRRSQTCLGRGQAGSFETRHSCTHACTQDDDGQVNLETVRAVTGSIFMFRIPFRNKAEAPIDVSYSLLCPPIVTRCPGALNPNSTICPNACPLGTTPDELGTFKVPVLQNSTPSQEK